jgi:hypothetical protein
MYIIMKTMYERRNSLFELSGKSTLSVNSAQTALLRKWRCEIARRLKSNLTVPQYPKGFTSRNDVLLKRYT